MQLLIKKATILCASSIYHLKKKDLLIKDGVIIKIADRITESATNIIDQKNTYVSLGWVDVYADFCDPGYEHQETINTGMEAACAGGFTDVFIIPNTNPTTSNKSAVEYIKNHTGIVNVHPIGAVSKNIEGKDLAEMNDMHAAGAVAFSDGKKTIQDSGLMLKALQYVKTFDGVIIEIPEDLGISKNGLMHEGTVSTGIGVQGKPALAEDIHTYRNIELLRYTQSNIHLTGISTKKSMDLIRQAKKQHLAVSCSVSSYHLLYNHTQLESYNSIYKVNPPLRTEEDRKALIKAVEDGIVDCIASHHTPQHIDNKQVEFAYAKNGMITLQTMLNMLTQVSEHITLEKWIALLTEKPRELFKLKKQTITQGATACLTVFNTTSDWPYDQSSNKSLSQNSPLYGQTLTGKILCVVNNHQYQIHE